MVQAPIASLSNTTPFQVSASGNVLPLLALNISVATSTKRAVPKPAPRFQDYPAILTFFGTNASARLVSPADRNFRTMLKNGSAEKPNFAGDYIVVRWGCGSGCAKGAVINARTGAVAWLPHLVSECVQQCKDFDDKEWIDFRPDSKLLILNGLLGTEPGRRAIDKNDGKSGSFYYLFENGKFRLLYSKKAEPRKFDDD